MPEETPKTFTLEEIKEHKSYSSLWVVIHNKVYDVTKFVDEHPGGEEVLLEQGKYTVNSDYITVFHPNECHMI